MLQLIAPIATSEVLDVRNCINRIAVGPLLSPVSLPPFACSAMDGYALSSDALAGPPPYRLYIAGQSLAGHPLTTPVPNGASARIFTGAALPPGTDSVAIQEDCTVVPGTQEVLVNVPVTSGDNVRERGHDVNKGHPIAHRGQRLNEFDVASLAACGIGRAPVLTRPRVAIFSTGDELREPGTTLGPGQIYDANRSALQALLARLPVDVMDLGILQDEPGAIRSALAAAARDCNALVTSGGVSVGDADHVKQVVESIGHLDLWRLNLKPGKPLAFGKVADCWFFGLPGNPVSTVVTFLLLVQPALLKLAGAMPGNEFGNTFFARLLDPISHRPGREEYQRGRLTAADGVIEVRVTGDQSSNRLATFADADCLIRIPKSAPDLEPGTLVTVLPFRGLL